MVVQTLDLIAECLGKEVQDIDLEKSFAENGGHSLTAFALSVMLRKNDIRLTTANILLANRLSEIVGIDQRDEDSLTESRLSSEKKPSTDLDKHSEVKFDVTNRTTQSKAASLSNPKQIQARESEPHGTLELSANKHIRPFNWTPDDINQFRESTKRAHFKPRTTDADDHVRPCSCMKTEKLTPIPQCLNIEQVPVLREVDLLTEMQLKLLHGSLKTPGSNIIHYAETYLTLYLPLLRMAWRKVICIEPVFQTKLPDSYVGSSQIAFEWSEQSAESNQQYRYLVQQAFNETRIGCCFHVVTYRQKRGKSLSTIVWSVHHSFIDGFSLQILIQKVRKAASGICTQPGPPFSRVAVALQQYRAQNRERGRQFWADADNRLTSSIGYLNLPRPQTIKPELDPVDEVQLSLRDLVDNIEAAIRTSGVTYAAMFHAAWALVLTRLTDSRNVVFSTVLAGRDAPIPGIENVIGPVINTLPFIFEIDSDDLVKGYLQSVFKLIIELTDFQWTTSDKRSDDNIETALAMQFSPSAEYNKVDVLPVRKPETRQMADIPLSIAIEAEDTVYFRYHTHRFTKHQVELARDLFRQAVESLCCLELSIGTCIASMLSTSHLSKLRQWGNMVSGMTTKASVSDDLVTLFEKMGRRLPEGIAVEQGQETITYRQLDDNASQVATHLRSVTKPGDVVFAHADRSIAWLTGVYGILKAGAVYCPLEPSLPAHLKDHMFKIAKAKIFVAGSVSHNSLAPAGCLQFLAVEELTRESCSGRSTRSLHRSTPFPEQAAYVCFTSGSSGSPKGVICTHQGLVAFQQSLEVRLFCQPGKRVAQVMSPAFDGSIHEIFSTLSHGATLVLNSGTSGLFDNLDDVDSCILTPSMARVLDPSSYPRLKQVYLVGEPVPQSLSDLWTRYVNLYNMYGPTEATCGATIKHLKFNRPVTIGRPNPTTRVYVMDSNQSLAVPGAVGEIYLAGVQVSKGYLGLHELTAQRFFPDSICQIGEEMYKTGDRGYWNEDGELVLLGRSDREIKLRGYRLDLNDLETRVSDAHSEVSAVAILVEGDNLTAVVEPVDININALRQSVIKRLPAYAIPSRIVAVEQIPKTVVGKTDYRSLHSFTQPREQSTAHLINSTQEMVAEKMLSVLRLDRSQPIGPETTFGDLGGTSLDQVVLTSQISKESGLEIPLSLIIKQPSVTALARAIDQAKETTSSPLREIAKLGHRQASPIEADWFKKYKAQDGTSAFNVLYAANYDVRLVDRRTLIAAWNTVLKRHMILRSRYIEDTDGAVLRHFHDQSPQVREVDNFCISTEVNCAFDIKSDELVKVLIGDKSILVVASHIIADFTSLSILLDEVAQLYHGRDLSPPINYADSTIWNKELPPSFARWWIDYLSTSSKQSATPVANKAKLSYEGDTITTKLCPKLWTKMQRFVSGRNISLQQLSLAAAGMAFSDQTSQIDITLGSPYINRHSEADFATVGLYLEPLPIRIIYASAPEKSPVNETAKRLEIDSPSSTIVSSLPSNTGSSHYLSAVRESCQDALAHVIPWHRLLRLFADSCPLSSHPLFDVMVSFHERSQMKKISGASIDGIKPCLVWSQGSKFKLMVEFIALSEETLLMRLEYDTDFFELRKVRKIAARIVTALDMLVDECEFIEIAARVDMKGADDGLYLRDLTSKFGTQINIL